MILGRTYLPKKEVNKMRGEGDVAAARKAFLEKRFNNLVHLLKGRFSWLDPYIEGKKEVYELGSGPGFLKEFVKNEDLRLTDVEKHPWIDVKVDALNLPFEKESVDVLICSHMLHHLASPMKFLSDVYDALRPGGLVLIVEINTSLFLRFLLKIMRHEGWSYEVDVFSDDEVCNRADDPWSANCAIPELLFSDEKKFENSIPGFKIIRNELFESMLLPLSGGVIAKTKMVQLPVWLLKGVEKFDSLLVKVAPSIFSVGRKVILKKV